MPQNIKIRGLDGFNQSDLITTFKVANVNGVPTNVNRFYDLGKSGWEFHEIDDRFYSAAAKNKLEKLNNEEDEDETGNFNIQDYFPGGVLGYSNTPGMSEYYIFKKGGIYYTFASNKFEYSGWDEGGRFEILSDINKFNDLSAAMNFVKQDALQMKKTTMFGHTSDDGGEYDVDKTDGGFKLNPSSADTKQLTEAEMPIHKADDIFAKYGVTGASLMDSERLKDEYKNLVKKYHPDVSGENPLIMRDINSAYDAIKKGGKSDDGEDVNIYHDDKFDIHFRKLKELGKYLEEKFKNIATVSLNDISGGLLIIEFNENYSNKQFYIGIRQNKFSVVDVSSDNPSVKFNFADIEGIYNFINKNIDSLEKDK